MKDNIIASLRITFISVVIFAGGYTLLILGIAHLAPYKGEGKIISRDNRTVGYTDEGQSFTNDNYFISRPSAVDYNAAGSGGSNKGPSNPGYLKEVNDRIDTILAHNPSVKKENIPSDLVTASGSGLDPDISYEAAMLQIDRISKIRKLSFARVARLVNKQTEKPLFGPVHINVLKLNLELDKLK